MGGGSREKILMKQRERERERNFWFWKEEILNGFLCVTVQTPGKETSACTQSVQGEIVARR